MIKEAGLYRGTDLPDGTFALATTSAGMGIVDRQGKRVALVNRAAGLPSDVVYYTMRDAEGALWLALDAGVARVETPSPVSFFDHADGLGGGIAAAIRHEGRLYLALQTGIRYLDPAPARTGAPRILPVERSSTSQCWGFAQMPLEGRPSPALLATCNEGLYENHGHHRGPHQDAKRLVVQFVRPEGLGRRSVAGLDRVAGRPRLVQVRARALGGRRPRGRYLRGRALDVRRRRRLAVGGHGDGGRAAHPIRPSARAECPTAGGCNRALRDARRPA